MHFLLIFILWRKWADDNFGRCFSCSVYLNLQVHIQSVGLTCYARDEIKSENASNYVTLGIKHSPKYFSLFPWILQGTLFYCIMFIFSIRNLPDYPVYCRLIRSVRFLCTSAFIQTFSIWELLLILASVLRWEKMPNTLIYFVGIWKSGECA